MMENPGPDRVEHSLWGKAGRRRRRRKNRPFRIAEAMAAHPGRTIPQVFETPHEIDAVYEIFKRHETAPDRIEAGHRKRVRPAMGEPGRVWLILEDSVAAYGY